MYLVVYTSSKATQQGTRAYKILLLSRHSDTHLNVFFEGHFIFTCSIYIHNYFICVTS